MKVFFYFFILLCAMGACTNGHEVSEIDRKEARSIMDLVRMRNLSDTLLTMKDDTLMHKVLAYYKTFGSSNELMEAYYLQGSVYRDLHDAPRAMESYLQGINVADTLDENCRFDILTRLYGQRNELLRKQTLFRQALEEIPLEMDCAIRAKDTLFAIESQWSKLGLCYLLNDKETIATECWQLLEKSKEWNCYKYAVSRLNTSILANIELGKIREAEKLLTIYEQHGGTVNLETIESTFPVYYHTKGRLLLAQKRPKEAETFFRKEAKETDWNNRQGAYRGLREVFEQTGQLDSALKYARLQCEAVDSDYQQKATMEVQNLQQLYDYTRTQEDNYFKDKQLQTEQRRQLYLRWCIAFYYCPLNFLH